MPNSRLTPELHVNNAIWLHARECKKNFNQTVSHSLYVLCHYTTRADYAADNCQLKSFCIDGLILSGTSMYGGGHRKIAPRGAFHFGLLMTSCDCN